MANRVLLGQRGGEYGFWVSKPGQNVLTATDVNLLIAKDLYTFQIIYTARVFIGTDPSFSVNVTIPNYGYKPTIITFCKFPAAVLYNSNTSVTLRDNPYSELFSSGWGAGDAAYLDYAITTDRVP
jgi:hypothetical protein